MEKSYTKVQREAINQEFKWIGDNCYLDHAGAALYSSSQWKSITADLGSNLYSNPHSLHYVSKHSNDVINQIRHKILDFFHTNSDTYSVIFTSGATASIKLVVESFIWNGIVDEKPDYNGEQWFDAVQERGSYVYMKSNHTSVVGGREVAAERGANIICLPDAAAQMLLDEPTEFTSENPTTNSLFVYSAQCNFSGRKYPLKWIKSVQNGALACLSEVDSKNSKWYVLLDAASYCATSDLDLSRVCPDFLCLSFYKIFGYPTGLGALLVRNTIAGCLKRRYFGGGTVDIALPGSRFFRPRAHLHDRFEDGTLPYLSIISLGHGFDTFLRLGLNMQAISMHVFNLARETVMLLKTLRHSNGALLVEIYADSDFSDITVQGGIITFNLKKPDGTYIGYVEVLHIANLYKVQLRTGCFCNIGACQRHLTLSDDQLLANYKEGHVCGDERDLVQGIPTGAIRVSFGYSSSIDDIHRLLRMLQDSFVVKTPAMEFSEDFEVCSPPRLSSIRVYPVKSCGAMEVASWRLTPRGLNFDRQWMIVKSNGICLTQKEEPLLCRVLPTVQPISGVLTLTFGGTDPLLVSSQSFLKSDTSYNLCISQVCGDRVEGEDCGAAVTTWLTKHLRREGLRLVRQGKDDTRKSKVQALRSRGEAEAGQLSLANQAQYLIINANSVKWLRKRMEGEQNFNLETLQDRFRANFIVSGIKPFDELLWKFIKIGKIQIKVEGPCTRCQMICIDQHTGEKNRKPLVALSTALQGKLRFGVYCSHIEEIGEQIIHVGDNFFVQELII